jgi:hypothetical protein
MAVLTFRFHASRENHESAGIQRPDRRSVVDAIVSAYAVFT